MGGNASGAAMNRTVLPSPMLAAGSMVTGQNIVPMDGDDMSSRCMVHKHKELEFFCRTCSKLVCSNCMFYEHNGHALS